jgi:hypothetical protein
VEVRHISRSSSATRHPKVYTGTTVLSQDIVHAQQSEIRVRAVGVAN